MTTSRPVIAVYEFPQPIWVDHNVLGGRFETHIGPLSASIITPPIADGGRVIAPKLSDLPHNALAPLLGERPHRLDAYPASATGIDPEWATEYAAHHTGGATALRAVCIELSESPAAPIHNDIHSAIGDHESTSRYSIQGTPTARIADVAGRNIEAWYTRLAEWVTVLTEQDLDHHHRIYDASLIAPGLRVWQGESWNISASRYQIPTVIPIDLSAWRETLLHIGECKRPPLEWQLLVQAAKAVDRGYYRRAMIDYATAAEVCLSRIVQTSTAPASKPSKKSNLHTWSNWLVKHEPILYTVDQDFDVLVNARNNAAHRGIEPSPDDITTSARCAHRIV
ncbi:hypothetical protein [Rhodococcus sp. AQ5-07]|uniref:hypothetical protein n=1 Tax=Rhodococcus sp. AQ5-07 TaxID=2054902 RepID=UPI0012B60D91|nr:hypothetical protein [Rhodococcus sp. AQ5-07]